MCCEMHLASMELQNEVPKTWCTAAFQTEVFLVLINFRSIQSCRGSLNFFLPGETRYSKFQTPRHQFNLHGH